jgi:NmrA-like family
MTKLWINALQSIGEALDMHNLDREPGRIFITEVSSEVGQTIASRLIQSGYAQVRLGATAASTTSSYSSRGVEIVEFSWDREETYANALNGVKSVIITIPYKQHWYKYFSTFVKACKKAKVKHYVKLSFYLSQVPGTRKMPFVKHHTNCDEMLMNMIIPDEEHVTQMSYTIIAATHVMSHPIQDYHNKLSGDTDVATSTTLWNASPRRYAANYISPRDVAEAVTRVVLSPHDHYNRIYTIFGPELVTNADLAALMSLYFGKQIKCIDCINMTDYRNKILETQSKCSLWYNKDQIALQQVMASGMEEHVANLLPNDFVRICGHSPERFLDYLTYRCPTTAAGGGTNVFTKMVGEPMFGCGGGAAELFHV